MSENSIERGMYKSIEMYTKPFDLVEAYNNENPHRLVKLDYGNIINEVGLFPKRIATTAISMVGVGTAVCLNPEYFFVSGDFSILGMIALSGFSGFLSFSGVQMGFGYFDQVRLKRYAKSKNPKKRTYYVNRVLDHLIFCQAEDSTLFDNTFLLAYSLWLHEKGRELRSLRKHNAYRKFFAKANIEKFIEDELSSSYLMLAHDINERVFNRMVIPRIAHTVSEKRMFKKYASIIDARKDYPSSLGYLLSSESEMESTSSDFASWGSDHPWVIKERAKSKLQIMETAESVDLQIPQTQLKAKQATSYVSKFPFEDDFSEIMQSLTKADDCENDPLHEVIGFENEMKSLKAIESEWLGVQSDIVKLLKYPMLSDMSEPMVQKFHTCLDYAQSLASKTMNNDFVLAVSSLKTAWTSLIHESHRVELSKFDNGERKKILMASSLMNIALNDASSASERQSAYRKAMEQLKGLIVLPQQALLVIEQSSFRKEISA